MTHLKAPIQIRVATPQDAARIYSLVQSAYRGEESKLGWTTEADLLAGDRIDIPGIQAKMSAPDSVILIATAPHSATPNSDGVRVEAPGQLVGCCEVRRLTPELAYFGLFAVSPRHQGAGVGKQVMAYAEDYCRRTWGAKRLELSVIWTRTELIAWYGRRGYRKTGERPFPMQEVVKVQGVALREDLHLHVMEKQLSGRC